MSLSNNFCYFLRMSDFIKIFLVLCAIAMSFVFGRNYGEKTITESKDYLKLQSDAKLAAENDSQIANLKQKIQNLLDSSDLKKADQVLSQIMTLFLADLGMHLSEQQQKDFDQGKQLCFRPETGPLPEKKQVEAPAKPEPSTSTQTDAVDAETKKSNNRQQYLKKFKTAEWFLKNSRNEQEVARNLKKLQLKDLDIYLKNAPESNWEKSRGYFGSYRGRITDITNKDYGMLVVNLKQALNSKNENVIKGNIQIFKNEKQESEGNFTTNHFGYGPEELLGTVVNVGFRYLQIYSLDAQSKLAGILYERLPNGTTKTVGTFLLNRVDQF